MLHSIIVFCVIVSTAVAFECPAEGRFIFANNPSSYVLCVQWPNGTLVRHHVICPEGTLYSSLDSRCVQSDGNNIYPSEDGYEHELCSGNGRFVDERVRNCSGYLLCTQLSDDSFTSRQVSCPEMMLYNENQRRCVLASTYNCATIDSTTEKISTTAEPEINNCQRGGRQVDPEVNDCSGYLLCISQSDGGYISTKVVCPDDTLYSDESSRCVPASTYICPSLTTDSTTQKISTTAEPAINNCQRAGRQIDPEVNDCSGYLLCISQSDSGYISTKVVCPNDTLYSDESSRCVPASTYNCPTLITPTTPKPTCTIGGGEPGCESELPIDNHKCNGSGHFADPSSLDCSKYLICTQFADGSFSAGSYFCPDAHVFAPHEGKCVPSTQYNCSEPTSPPKQRCPGIGAYPDESATNCYTYLSCTYDDAGAITGRIAMCPEYTLFSKETGECLIACDVVC